MSSRDAHLSLDFQKSQQRRERTDFDMVTLKAWRASGPRYCGRCSPPGRFSESAHLLAHELRELVDLHRRGAMLSAELLAHFLPCTIAFTAVQLLHQARGVPARAHMPNQSARL